MIKRRSVWTVWALCVLAVLVVTADIVVNLQNADSAHQRLSLVDALAQIEISLIPITFTLVGAFVLARRPGNRIGWLMLLIGLGYGLGGFTSDYPSISAQTHRPTRPFGTFALWLQTWDFTVYLSGLFLLLLLFPTGELAGRRWRPVLWVGLAAWGAVSVVGAIGRHPGDSTTPDNPYGLIPLPEVVIVVLAICGLLAMAGALLSLILRFRSARGVVRQQLKWVTYGAALATVFVIAAFATLWSIGVVVLLALASLAGLPIFMGVAILRYRLYDIDVLVNRTLVYGSLSASLALVYVVGVVSLQALFRLVSGGTSELAIAVSTLIIAALFQPLRGRIQHGIDHRFYRRKYDAARTLAAFEGRLRDEVDLDRLTGDLLSVVQDTVQPAQVSLWLR